MTPRIIHLRRCLTPPSVASSSRVSTWGTTGEDEIEILIFRWRGPKSMQQINNLLIYLNYFLTVALQWIRPELNHMLEICSSFTFLSLFWPDQVSGSLHHVFYPFFFIFLRFKAHLFNCPVTTQFSSNLMVCYLSHYTSTFEYFANVCVRNNCGPECWSNLKMTFRCATLPALHVWRSREAEKKADLEREKERKEKKERMADSERLTAKHAARERMQRVLRLSGRK